MLFSEEEISKNQIVLYYLALVFNWLDDLQHLLHLQCTCTSIFKHKSYVAKFINMNCGNAFNFDPNMFAKFIKYTGKKFV